MIKIAITGPESTGKSMLAQQLADHYGTVWVPEYARVYLLQIDRPYEYDDILEIARGQQASEAVFEPIADKLLFADTEMLVTKIWCDVRYGRCHPWIETQLQHQDYALYLLPDIDLPWTYDPLREHPHMREQLMERYKTELNRLGFPYRVIRGSGETRFKNARLAVDEYLGKTNMNRDASTK